MTLTSRLIGLSLKAKNFNTLVYRNYASISQKELEVPTFCDIYIDLPYNVRIKPLNIHKYHNLDKLIIQMDERYEAFIEHDINGNRVEIFSSEKSGVESSNEKRQDDIPSDIFCSVKAPIKANVNVKSKKNIIAGYFNGDKLHLRSLDGDIFVDKFQGNSVKLKTNNGNINLKEFIQASTIIAEIKESGSITTGRLHGLDLKLRNKCGNISVESSYATETLFEVDQGNLDLQNVHKSCRILLKEGKLNLTGFDGKLKTFVEKGSADIQLSRITEDSEISVLNGALSLKISESCQEYVEFKIQAKACDFSENIKSNVSKLDGILILTPDIHNECMVLVNCSNGTVNVESASWRDMIKSKLQK